MIRLITLVVFALSAIDVFGEAAETDFKLGTQGSTTCPYGYSLVTDEVVCRSTQVHTWSGKIFGSVDCYGLETNGCFAAGNNILFSECENSAASAAQPRDPLRSLVCQKEMSCEEFEAKYPGCDDTQPGTGDCPTDEEEMKFWHENCDTPASNDLDAVIQLYHEALLALNDFHGRWQAAQTLEQELLQQETLIEVKNQIQDTLSRVHAHDVHEAAATTDAAACDTIDPCVAQYTLPEGSASTAELCTYAANVDGCLVQGCGISDHIVPYIHTQESCRKRILGFGIVKDGRCLTPHGAVQTHGVTKAPGDFSAPYDCLTWCAMQDDLKGCEFDHSNGSCYAHTADVSDGNGVFLHYCWVYDIAGARDAEEIKSGDASISSVSSSEIQEKDVAEVEKYWELAQHNY